jgi:phospholipid/cholesterol/gamma-HCH transport system ATP-binding protein
MASKPQLLLFDDPITGLDPLIATDIDHEIVKLRDLEDVTAFVVTHQIRDAFYIAEHKAEMRDGKIEVVKADSSQITGVKFMVLHDGAIMFEGTAGELLTARDADPYLKEYLYKTLPPW